VERVVREDRGEKEEGEGGEGGEGGSEDGEARSETYVPAHPRSLTRDRGAASPVLSLTTCHKDFFLFSLPPT